MFKKFLSFILSVALSTSTVFTAYANKDYCNKNLIQSLNLGPSKKAFVQYISHDKIGKMLKEIKNGMKTAEYVEQLTSAAAFPAYFVPYAEVAVAAVISGSSIYSLAASDQKKYWKNLLGISEKGGNCGVAVASIIDYGTMMSPWCDSDCAANMKITDVYKVAQPNSPDPRCVFYHKCK